MRLKSFVSLIVLPALVAANGTAAAFSASAEPRNAAEPKVLFADKFDVGYSDGYISRAAANELEYYSTDRFALRYDVRSEEYTARVNNADITVIQKSQTPGNIAKLTDDKFSSSGGKSLQLTSQGIVVNGAMYRSSGITDAEISGRALVFNIRFKIPADGIYNRGVGFAAGLSPANSAGTAPDAVCSSRDLTLDGNSLKNKYKFFAASGYDFYVFGKKTDTLKKGEVYDFTLKMVPDSDNSEYSVYAKLNDYEVEVFSDSIPTPEELKTYSYGYIALHNHGWFTYAGSKNEDGTSSYTSDKPLVYIDDISLKSAEKSEIMPQPVNTAENRLFNDDFSSYDSNGGYIKKADSDSADEYETDEFVLNYGASSISSDSKEYPGAACAGNVERAAAVSELKRFGNGKSLQLRSQGILSGASMWKRSNITYERIENKTLVFKTDFMIPSDGLWNRGTVAAITFSGRRSDSDKPDAVLNSVDFLLDNLNSKYMLAGIGYCDYKRQLRVFGENISELEDDTVYNLTVTMIPEANGGYSVHVRLNDLSKTLSGSGVPTAEEVGSYAYAGIINHAHKWHTCSVFSGDNPYINDRDLIYIDNISLNAEPTFFVSAGGDNSNDGSADAPFKTMRRAFSEARSGINTTIVADGAFDVERMPELKDGCITVTGREPLSKINLSDNFECCSDVAFDNLELGGTSVFANGHKLTVTDSVTSSGRLTVYGGGNGTAVSGDTDLRLYGGKYNRVYGGSLNAPVNGNTNIIFGGSCNAGDGTDDSKTNVSPCYIYGGGSNGRVSGKTNVTLSGNAVTKYIVGSGSSTDGSVGESTNIRINGGKVMNVYAGSAGSAPALNSDTNITMTGGTAESLFGGSEGTNLTGNAHLYLLGGEVTRRIFSGCYNGTKRSGLFSISIASSNHVIGSTSIVIDDNAKLITKNGLSSDNKMNTGIFAGSRIAAKRADEVNTLIFLNGSYSGCRTLIGDTSGWSDVFGSFETYTVKASGSGAVDSVGAGKISVYSDNGTDVYADGKICTSEIISISPGVTTVEFVKDFCINSIVLDETNNKISVDYAAENSKNEPEPKLYVAVYEKLNGDSKSLAKAFVTECRNKAVSVFDIGGVLDGDKSYIIKAMIFNEEQKPLTSYYEIYR